MTDIALNEKALEAGAEAVLELWRKQGLENCSSLEMAEEAISAYLRASSSQVAPANPAQVTDAMVEAGLRAAEEACMEHTFGTFREDSTFETAFTDEFKERFRLMHRRALLAAIGAGGQAVAWQQRELKNGQWSDWYPSNKEAYEEHQAGVEGALSRYEVRALTPTQPHPADERVVEAPAPGTIRICPTRDRPCPHGLGCPYVDGYNCTDPALSATEGR